MNKIIPILVLMMLWDTCKANNKIIEGFGSKPEYKFCLERLLKEKLIRDEIILYRFSKESLFGVTRNLMDAGFTVTSRRCDQGECIKDFTKSHRQYLIHVTNAQVLNYTMMECICEWTSDTEFVIITPNPDEVFSLLKVLQLHVVPANRATVVTFGDNVLHYRRGLPRCDKVEHMNETLTYDCRNHNKQINIKTNMRDFLQCEVRYGVRLAPPFTFIPDEKQAMIIPGLKYMGIEIALLMEVLGLPRSFKVEASDINDLGTYDKTTGTRTGLLKELHEGRIDVLIGAIYIEDCAAGAEYANPIYGSKLVAITRKEKAINVFSVFTVFSLRLWLFVLGIGVSLLFIVSHVLRRRTKLDIVTLIFYLVAALMGKSIPLNSKFLKLLLPMWIFLAFFLRICFEAHTVEGLTKRDADEQINDLYTLCSENYTIYVTELYYPYLRDGFNVSDCRLSLENIIIDDDPLERLYEEGGNVATVMFRDHFVTSLVEYVETDREEPFHVVEEVVQNIPFVLCYKNGDPIGFVLKSGSVIATRGFVDFHYRMANMFRLITIGALLRHKTKNLSLGLGQMAPAFYLYFIGVLISFTVFVVELMVVKLSKRSRSR